MPSALICREPSPITRARRSMQRSSPGELPACCCTAACSRASRRRPSWACCSCCRRATRCCWCSSTASCIACWLPTTTPPGRTTFWIRSSRAATARWRAPPRRASPTSSAAADLDTLQQLAVTEKTLAGWVKDTVYGLTDQWLEAASSLTPPPGSQPAPEPVHEALLAAGAAPPALLAPLTEAQRAGLRAELAGKWRWSEGIELLERYHAAYGFGLVSQHKVLTWTGKLQAQDVLKGVHELSCAEKGGLVGSHHPAATALQQGLAEFLRQDLGRACSPPHISLCGNATDRWLFASWALQYLRREVTSHSPELRAAAGGLRTLVLPAAQLGSLADLAWSLSQHPRTRFVVLANGMGGDGGSGGAVGGDVAAMLSGFDGFSWPSNALLVGGFPGAVPEQLAPVFRHTAAIEDRFAA